MLNKIKDFKNFEKENRYLDIDSFLIKRLIKNFKFFGGNLDMIDQSCPYLADLL